MLRTMEQLGGAPVLSVAELTTRIRLRLEGEFPDVTVEGELSNVRPASSGHLYFTLKDEDALLSCVLFRNRAAYLAFEPGDGMLVHASGRISVYARRGTYQLVCETLSLAGTGAILAMLEERKRRLAAEGLFDSDKKRPLPPFPKRIAVVTSPTGAAIRDILNVLGRRNAGIDVVVLPTAVQGSEAGARIAAQILRADRYKLGEVIIVGRGGGSLEDLLPFSEESVVRAIATVETPVVSAVGHEVDSSLSDLAADIRAPTPSAAAEMVSENRENLVQHLSVLRRSLEESLTRRTEELRRSVARTTPEELERLFRGSLQPSLLRLDDAKESLLRSFREKLQGERHRLTLARRSLDALGPRDVLRRGYAIVRSLKNHRLVTESTTVTPGEGVRVAFSDGSFSAEVREHGKETEF
ncbi:MAG: exodeoxyribonuclease VII large subunit [Spirochaetota bacterium]